MAEDVARAERLKAAKKARPKFRWREIAEAAGVKERSVLEWAKTGALSYEHAEAVCEFLEIDLDLFWRGPKPESPDLMDALKAADLTKLEERLRRIEDNQAEVLRLLRLAVAELPDEPANSLPLTTPAAPGV